MQWNKRILHLLKIVLPVLGFLYIIYLIHQQIETIDNLSTKKWLHSLNPIYLFACLILLPINWGIETIKWILLVKPLQKLSVKNAIIGILSGVSVSFFTPNRTGEFAGRIMPLKAQNRITGTIASLLGSSMQLITTLFFGFAGIAFLYTKKSISLPSSLQFNNSFLKISIISFTLATICIFGIRYLLKKNKTLSHQYLRILAYIKQCNARYLLSILWLSMLRYSIFSLQFAFLLYFFDVSLDPFLMFSGITATFLINTMIPSFALAEFGIRGSIAAFIFTSLSCNPISVIAASATLWIINLALPALVGTIIWNKYKIR